jgi:hypothetical protein
MKMKFRYLLITTFLILSGTLFSQEYLTGTGINENVAAKAKELEKEQKQKQKCGCQRDKKAALTLPFFDDFSVSKVYPDKNKWEDNFVYVNKHFAFSPPNIGVATFDALDAKGKVYEDANWIDFIADHLTSNPIRTDSLFEPVARKLSPSDSVYLSFYYQPQGRGNDPEPWDTLLLQFAYRTGDTVFSHMDSIDVLVNGIYVMTENDTVYPGDTLWAPPGCNPNVFTISYVRLTWNDMVTVACDSVMIPELKWKTMWKKEGEHLSDFEQEHGKYFVQVMVPLTDPKFFFEAFQFRFLNYASIANENIPSWRSNMDQWNVDMVYLNYNRSVDDTTYRMLSFSERAPSFLKYYQSMPYRQYRADISNSQARSVEMYITNLDKVEHNTRYMYKVQQVAGDYSYTYDGGSCNLLPYYEGGYQSCNSCKPHACPDISKYFALDYDVDTMSFWITHYISDSSNVNSLVDSVKFHQGFYNYFSYDDGTPELGYGLEPAGANLGYQFKVNTPDTLQGVQIYFNRTKDNTNEFYFTLKVWRDNNGQPGQEIYAQENMQVKWSDDWPYKFYYYQLDEPFVISGTFYIGWEQYSAGSLNVGFDSNNDEHERIYYTIDDEWYQSNYYGALLIRPVVGAAGYVGTNEHTISGTQRVNIFPNPAGNSFRFDPSLVSHNANDRVTVYNMMGSVVKEQNMYTTNVKVNDLPEGLYIVKIRSNGNNYVAKLIINR